MACYCLKGLSIKDVRGQGRGEGLSSADKGSSDAANRTFRCKKLRIFKIYGVSARLGTEVRVSFLRFLCVLYGRPLT